MPGHIALGQPGALREYMIANTDLYSKSPANQFAAKLSTGAGDYDDLENWSYFVMDDWQAGVGQKDAEAGGFLYATLETRYPQEMRLPRAMTMSHGVSAEIDRGYAPPAYGAESSVTIGTGQSVHRVSRRIVTGGDASTVVYVRLILPNDAINGGVTVALYSDSAGSPNASLASTTVTPVDGVGYGEYLATITYATVASTNYHIVVHPTTAGQSLTLPTFTTSVPSSIFYDYNGSAWANTTTRGWLHEVKGTDAETDVGGHIIYYSAFEFLIVGWDTYIGIPGGGLAVGTTHGAAFAASITSLLPLGAVFLVGQGNSSNAYSVDDDIARTDLGYAGNLFVQWNGYVWRSVANNLYYSADLSTWTGPIEVTVDGWEIRGMAGLGDYLYVATDNGLYYIGYGDQVLKVTNWAGVESTNGTHMINYHGALFVSAGEALFRYDGNAILPVGLDKGEGLPSDRSGTVAALLQQNNWLFAAINATNGQDSVWAFNDQGWHCIAVLPAGVTIANMSYQRGANAFGNNAKRLSILCTNGLIFTCYLPDVAREAEDATGWAVWGWVETDWFFGGLKEVQKDFESVYISGENFSADQYAQVYWQDDDSTDWELLGTVTSDRQELRWSDYDTRPNTRQLKLGIALYTKDVDITPIIRAVRVKYHPMVSDWFRWSFPLLVSDNQQELGGTLSPHSAATKRAHLDTLITQVPPFIYRDMDGTQYECKVMGAQIQHTTVEWIGGEMVFDSIYNLTIEAIRNGSYEA